VADLPTLPPVRHSITETPLANTDTNSITALQPTVFQVLDTEVENSLAVGIGGLATRQDAITVEAAVETQTGVDSIYGGTGSVTTETETGHETHDVSIVTQNISPSLSIEVEAVPKETSLRGRCRNVAN
jgi:hypothetical protein